MKPKHSLLFCLSFLIIHSSLLIATVRYVSKTGSSTPPYTSWQTAADSIQKCINICSFGDTVYVANGIYKEQVIMIPGLSLIGAGMDSCMIDTQELVTSQNYNSVIVADSCLLTGFHINIFSSSLWGRVNAAIAGGSGNNVVIGNKITNARNGIVTGLFTSVYKNLFGNVSTGVVLWNSNAILRDNYIITDRFSEAVVVAGIYILGPNNFTPLIDSNYIETDATGSEGISQSLSSNPTITNNILNIKRGNWGILSGSTTGSIKIFNNLIIGGYDGIYNGGTQYLQVINNLLPNSLGGAGISHSGPYDVIKNNVISNSIKGITAWSTPPTVQYNNVWNTSIPYSGLTPDSTNISVDPMIVNDDTTNGELDFHLQKYSPLIDAGDPNILDKDGSRSDIGLYGGPFGETYTYPDLPPRAPLNLTAEIDTFNIRLKWNKNTEADTAFYKVYRDTVAGFTIDSTKIIASVTDTSFVQSIPHKKSKVVYKITCVDKQGNESLPSEEVVVDLTSVSTDELPITINHYILYQNYPNPFNPSTKIAYRLKESGYVKLYVYDIKGELISTLVNQHQSSGFYEVEFSLSSIQHQDSGIKDLASGIYIYQIMVKSENNIPVFSDIKKMIYLK